MIAVSCARIPKSLVLPLHYRVGNQPVFGVRRVAILAVAAVVVKTAVILLFEMNVTRVSW